MRVLMISDHADPLALPGSNFHGGQNVYVRQLATRLAASGCHVDVATRADAPDFPAWQPIAEGAQVVRVEAGPRAPMPRDRFGSVLDAFSRGVDDLCEQRGGYDVVHSHYWFSGVAALGLAARHGLPVVHSHHSIGAVRRQSLDTHQPVTTSPELFDERHQQECRIGREAAAVVANCPAEAADMQHLLGTPAEAVHLVPPGVDTAVLRPFDQTAARERLGLPLGVPLVLFVGRLEARKGCLDLVKAFARVSVVLPHARLVVVGGTAHETQVVRDLAAQLGFGDRTEFRGSVSHELTPLYYSAADVTAVPSHYEPFGLVAIESMACATPVVATRVGGLAWSVVDGRCGALVPAREPISLACGLLDVLTAGRDRYRRSCLDQVAQHFTVDLWSRGILDVYRAVSSPVTT
ncbi:glycosyltransferase [Streptomyces roseirectus]|uniref:D-inositol 3-phosphate glycosyltransferase n=1 Tax=Streptomyces roseirectus TaxID=2768066 RepID=A0A7H0I7V2_9ACTN|nr:glycosyltransferase [Streptomyces roseirectus]QNP68868.1 glycosyltransferase [Streptomyces roseirectus]